MTKYNLNTNENGILITFTVNALQRNFTEDADTWSGHHSAVVCRWPEVMRECEHEEKSGPEKPRVKQSQRFPRLTEPTVVGHNDFFKIAPCATWMTV